MSPWQRRLFLFGQEWLGALMLLWLRYEKDPLLGKAALGYLVSMIVAWWMYLDVWRRIVAWRERRRSKRSVLEWGPDSPQCPPTLRSRR